MQAIQKAAGRNDPCPCGSGKKYKQCCISGNAAQAASQVAIASSIRRDIQSATDHHEAGQLPEAEALYRRVLEQEPDNAHALHMTGLIAHNMGRHEDAAELIGRAMRNNPTPAMLCNLGIVRVAQGNRDGAVESFRQAVVLKPDYAEAHGNLGTALNDQGKRDEATKHLRRAIAIKPDYVDAHFNMGNLLQSQNKLDEASRHYRRAIALRPDHASAHYNLGVLLMAQDKLDEASEHYCKTVALRPNHVNAHYNLGVMRHGQGRLDEAAAFYRTVLALKADYANGHFKLAVVLQMQGKLDEAARHYHQELALAPENADAHYNLGGLIHEQGKLDEAAEHYRQALSLKPAYAKAHYNLGNVCLAQNQPEQASLHYRQAIALAPDYAGAFCSLGIALHRQGKLNEALENFRHGLALDPGDAKAHACLAGIHVDMGRFDPAQAEISKALEIDPDLPLAWSLLPSLRKMTGKDEPWLLKTLSLLQQPHPAGSDDAIGLQFAAGKYYDDTGQYDLAFSAYTRANTLKRQRIGSLDRIRLTRHVDAMIGTYTADFIRQHRDGSSSSERPVLIVGMPRSGTSLTEQIIATHPAAFGAGELPYWGAMSDADVSTATLGNYDQAFLGRMAGEYERQLAHYSATARRVVDKMPGNFSWIGLIVTVFPQARIIHMERDAVDTCLSNFFQNFNARHAYATDLDDLLFYYREYARIMQHWRNVLPAEQFFDLPYEALIADQEGWSRRIISFIGLDWDQRCMDFHETERKVGTSSNWQVRQKIYHTSKARWRNYEQHLGPLRALQEIVA